jgi:hypothetical protein
MNKLKAAGPPLCPSAHSSAPTARLFAVQVRNTQGEQQLAYLTETQEITDQVMQMVGTRPPHEVLRVAAHCIEGACPHWNGNPRGNDAAANRIGYAALRNPTDLPVVQTGRTGRLPALPADRNHPAARARRAGARSSPDRIGRRGPRP